MKKLFLLALFALLPFSLNAESNLDKILSRLDSAFSEKGKRANNATKNIFFIFFYLTYLRSKCDYNLDALSFIHANKCSENERLTNKLTSFLF